MNINRKPILNNSNSVKQTKFTNILDNMFNKITSNSTSKAELNILSKDINKATYLIEEEIHKVLPNGGKFRKEFLQKEKMSFKNKSKEAVIADDLISKLKKKEKNIRTTKSFMPTPRKSILVDSTKHSTLASFKNQTISDSGNTITILENNNKYNLEHISPIKKIQQTPIQLPEIPENVNSLSKVSILSQKRSSILCQIVNKHRKSINNTLDKKNEILSIKSTFNNMTKDIKEVIKMPRMSMISPIPIFKDESRVNDFLMREYGVGQSNMEVSNRNHDIFERYTKEKNDKKIKEMEDEEDKFYQEKFGHDRISTTVDTNEDENIMKILEKERLVNFL
jgi:hypothetical protein